MTKQEAVELMIFIFRNLPSGVTIEEIAAAAKELAQKPPPEKTKTEAQDWRNPQIQGNLYYYGDNNTCDNPRPFSD